MDFSKYPIDSTEKAKRFFLEMGCSFFHMNREYTERFQEFKALKIPKETTTGWTYDLQKELVKQLSDPNINKDTLWSIHSQLERLAQNLKTKKALDITYKATELVISKLSRSKDKILVAETIIGRGNQIKFRHGLIFLAHDLGDIEMAKKFANMAISLCKSAEKKLRNSQIIKRCHQALYDCLQLTNHLEFED